MALSDNISDFEKNFKKAFAIELERKKKDTELKKNKMRAFNGSYSFSILSIAVSILTFRIFKS